MKTLEEMITAGRDEQARRAIEFANAEDRKRTRLQAIKDWVGPTVTVQADAYVKRAALIRGDRIVEVNLEWDSENCFDFNGKATMYKIRFYGDNANRIERLDEEPVVVALAFLFKE